MARKLKSNTTGSNNTAFGVHSLAPVKVERVTNHRKGTELHLGDGRRLAFGESAEVAADVRAAILAIGSGE